MKYLNEHSVRIGTDLSIVCFDDIKELRSTNIQLTAVDRPIYEMGYEAMHILMLRFHQTTEEDAQEAYRLKRYTLDGWIIRRGSEHCLALQSNKGESYGNQ